MDYKPSSQSSFISSAAANWAIPELEKKLAANPLDPVVLNNLGNAYFMTRDTEKALNLFLRAWDTKPFDSVIMSNIANAFEDKTEFDRALHWAKSANEANPKDQYAAFVYAECLLRVGQWRMGWDLYEQCRFSIPQCPFLKLTADLVTGLAKAEATRITPWRVLVLQEGGLGDVFLHFRFFQFLKELGAHITFAVDQRLHCLLENHPWVDKLLGPEGDKVVADDYDCWVSSFSLAGIFAPTPEAAMKGFPGYYFSSHGMQPQNKIIGGKLRVGVCWQAGEEQEYHKHRSLHQAHMQVLLENKDVDWVCLQWPYSAPTKPPFESMRVVDISDWEKTAEVVEDLDLVITVETGLMFLAAAIGTPTWVMLRNSFWYFLTEGSESVWFPNMRLYRAKGLTYDKAVIDVATDLKLAATRGDGMLGLKVNPVKKSASGLCR